MIRDLTTVDAAKLLGVTPHTLRLWEQRYGFPTSLRTPGVRRSFDFGEVMLLRDALEHEISIASAISRARANIASESRSFTDAIQSSDQEDVEVEAAEPGAQGASYHSVLRLLELIRIACDGDHAVVDLQPIIDLTVGAPVEYSVTLRLLDDDGQAIPSAVLGSIAQRYGLETQLDLLLVRSAAGLARRGHAVAVALSATSLSDPGIALDVETVIIDAAINVALLTFQLTERTVATPNAAGAAAFIRRVRAAGCRVTVTQCHPCRALLDGLVQRAPDCVSLDPAVITGLQRIPSTRRSVQAFVESAHAAGLLVAADGITDPATRELLRALDVDQGTGPIWLPVTVRPDEYPAADVRAGAVSHDDTRL